MRKTFLLVLAGAWLSTFAVLGTPTASTAATDEGESETGLASGAENVSPGQSEPNVDPADKYKPFIPKYQCGSGQRGGGPANELNT